MTHDKQPLLVVDDDQRFRLAVVSALEDEGYTVAQASDGQSALEYLHAHSPPLLIFLDWNMVPVNAPQFIAEVNKHHSLSRIPVVLLSADRRVEAKRRAHHFAACLSKPVDLDRLLDVVHQIAA
jgi:CheY-like chemotaxis protein